MSWGAAETLRYKAHILWGKMKPPVLGKRCHLCKGKGIVFGMDGWAAPTWETCSHCSGTGRPPDAD